MVDLWSYQSKEIEAAHLVAGEDEALETEKRVLANAEKLYAAAMGAFEQLYEGGARPKPPCAPPCATSRNWPATTPASPRPSSSLPRPAPLVGDVASSLRDYAEGINASPERLAEIEDRLALLDRLKRKYGKTVAEVIAFGEEVARKLAEVEDRDEILKALRTPRRSRRSLSRRRRRPQRRAQSRRRQTRQTSRSPDQLPRHEGPLRSRRAFRGRDQWE